MTATTVVALLAAGAGSRFAGPHHKLDGRLGGRTVLDHAIDAAVSAAVGPVAVVTGAHRPTLPDHVVELHNERWADGQATSLQRAVGWARSLDAGALVVGLGDQPDVTAEAWRRVAGSTSPIAVATYDGRRRNPVRLAASVWHLLPEEGDHGAREVIGVRADLVDEIPCPGSGADIDTVEDLTTWQNRSSTNSP